eukprot:605461_1
MALAEQDPNAKNNNPNSMNVWPNELIINQAYAAAFGCTKCRRIPRRCMADQDGRILCRPCAENINDTTTSNVAQRMVNQLKTKCLTLNDSLSCDAMNNSEDAEGTSKDFVATKLIDECEWIGTIESYNEHSMKCEFMIIECSECKTYQCRRKSMGKHLAECPESKIQVHSMQLQFSIKTQMAMHSSPHNSNIIHPHLMC